MFQNNEKYGEPETLPEGLTLTEERKQRNIFK